MAASSWWGPRECSPRRAAGTFEVGAEKCAQGEGGDARLRAGGSTACSQPPAPMVSARGAPGVQSLLAERC